MYITVGCHCSNGGSFTCSYNPGFICRNYLSLRIDQAVLRRSVGCKTYMGVLSLQGWRGESDCVNISEHDTKKQIVVHL